MRSTEVITLIIVLIRFYLFFSSSSYTFCSGNWSYILLGLDMILDMI